MTIPLARPIIGDEEVAAVTDVLRSGQLASGARVEEFETSFASRVGVERAVAVSNGTTALELALEALGIGPGDEVVVPSFTFIATVNAVTRAGATPVFADVEEGSFCISERTVRPHLSNRTAAVIAVHLYGHPADPAGLSVLCHDRRIALIEDAAQAMGASWKRRSVGSLGTVATFSFYPTKNMTTGEGGMVTTSDDDIADKVALLRNHGARRRYEHEAVGTNARMTELAAAIGIVQLAKLTGWQRRRAEIAAHYDQSLASEVSIPAIAAEAVHAYHQYTIRSQAREAIRRRLEAAGVGYGIYYETPCHRQKPYLDHGVSLPTTDRLASEVLSLPIRPDMTEGDVERVVHAVTGGAL